LDTTIKKLGLLASFAIYIPAAALLYIVTAFVIPYFVEVTGLESVLLWFIFGGIGVFLPLLVTALVILKREGFSLSRDTWVNRMRFKKLTSRDLMWSIGGLLLAGALSGVVMLIIQQSVKEFEHVPNFMTLETLGPGRYWILLVWLPYWILNILGEEILWRGVMLPRQELAFGNIAWLIHGIGWALFHVAFGLHLLLALVPLLLIQPYVVQKTKNTWTGVIMHAGLNGPSFVAISLGLI
jgi:membrane protease YdiL (CAAX protease family)